jgi:3-hydroxymyristoyl/3-hydroxydecanoyl-(acyl carrier protein) dehydratase
MGGGSPALPDERLLMIDEVELCVPDGGPKGLGYLRGVKRVKPEEWFFKAHFYQDPVWPGSLGLEAMIELLKVAARERWPGLGPGTSFEPIGVGVPHEWTYRGQVIPKDKLVQVEATITKVSDAERLIVADGHLEVDGRVIYQMKDFSMRVG